MSEAQPAEETATEPTGPLPPSQDTVEVAHTPRAVSQPSGDAPLRVSEAGSESLKGEPTPTAPNRHMEGDNIAPEPQTEADLSADGAAVEPRSDEPVDKVTPEDVSAASPVRSSDQKPAADPTPPPTEPPTDQITPDSSPPTPAQKVPTSPPSAESVSSAATAASPPSPARATTPPADSAQDDSGCDTEPEPERQSSAPSSMAEPAGPAMADVEQLARSVVTDTLEKAKQETSMQRTLDNQRKDPDTDDDGWLDIVGNGQLKKKVLTTGRGDRSARPQRSQLATVHLSARLEDGRPAAGLPERLTFGLGDGEVVTGLDMAVGLMQPGETAEVYMDSRFAYGEKGLDSAIPPDASLTFTVQLESVQPEPKYEEMSAEQRLEVGSQKRDRGNWWFKRDDFNHAIQCYRRALDFFDNESDEFTGLPDDVHVLFEERLKVHNNLAAAQMKLEAYDAALRSVQLVLTCQPDNVKALYRKGKILAAQNKVSEAADALREALRLSPDNRTVQTELNRVLGVQRKQAEDQKSLYRKMLGLPPAEDQPAPANTAKSFPVRLLVAGVACALAAVAVSRLKLF